MATEYVKLDSEEDSSNAGSSPTGSSSTMSPSSGEDPYITVEISGGHLRVVGTAETAALFNSSLDPSTYQARADFAWQCRQKDSNATFDPDAAPTVAYGINQRTQWLAKHSLEFGKKYRFRVNGQPVNGSTGSFAEYHVITSPKYNMTCLAIPRAGFAAETGFNISVHFPENETGLANKSPKYSFSTTSLLSRQSSPMAGPYLLPIGDPDKDYTESITVTAIGDDGSYAECNTTPSVLPPLKNPLQLWQWILTLSHQADVSGHSASFLLASTIADLLDLVLSLDTDPAQTLIDQGYGEILDQALNYSTFHPAPTGPPPAPGYIFGADWSAASNTDDLVNMLQSPVGPDDLKVAAVEAFQEASVTLELAAQALGRRVDDEQVSQIAMNIQNGLGFVAGNVLDEEGISSTSSAIDWTENLKNVVTSLLTTTDTLTRVLLSATLSDSPPLVFESAVTTVYYQKQSVERLQEANFTNDRVEGSVALPSQDAVFGNESTIAVVNSKFMAFPRNPFLWNQGDQVRSSVLSLDFFEDNGGRIDVRDTSEPLVFYVKNYDRPGFPEVVFMNDSVVAGNGLSYHKMTTGSSTVPSPILVMLAPPPHVIAYQVYMQYNEPPTPDNHNFTTTIPPLEIACDVSVYNLSGQDVTALFPWVYPEVNGTYYIGVKELAPSACRNVPGVSVADVKAKLRETLDNETYSLAIMTPRCSWWDQGGDKSGQWDPSGCTIGPNTTARYTQCLTTHLTAFGSDFMVPPNSIDFSTVFAKFANLSDNAAVFSTVIVMFGIYFIILFFVFKADKRDRVKWGVLPIADNDESDENFYLLTVYTGMKAGSGTLSKAGIILHGADGDTGPRPLAASKNQVFKRGSICSFLLSSTKNLGELTNVHVWHDNSGEGGDASWFLDRVVVGDLRRNKRYVFFCQRWMAVEMEDGKVDRFLSAAGRDQLTNFSSVFHDKTRKDISDGHLWFSVASRPTRSHFTRVQRASCCLSLVFLTMITNAMFYRTDDSVKQKVYRLGPLVFTLSQVWISFVSTIIVFPINFVIVYVFTKSRPRRMKITAESASKFATSCPADEYQVNGGFRGEASERKQSGLPHWCVYIGWVLVFLSATGSAFFVILYSMEWGAEKSGEWLTSILLSIFQSVLLIQPLKVLLFAVIVAFIYKKIGKAEVVEENALNEDEEFLPAPPDAKYVRAPAIPASSAASRAGDLAAARSLRIKELRMSTILWDVFKHFLVVAVVFYLAFSSMDTQGYYMEKSLKSRFPTFKKINTLDKVWTWSYNELQKVLFGHPGSKLLDDQSYRVGAAAFKQFRSQKGHCRTDVATFPHCKIDYSLKKYESAKFGVGWRALSDSRINETDLTIKDTNTTDVPDTNINATFVNDTNINATDSRESNMTASVEIGNDITSTERERNRRPRDVSNDRDIGYGSVEKDDSSVARSMASAWVYTSGSSLAYSGQVDTYTDGAYMFEVGNDPRQSVLAMRHLQENGWLDDFTEAVVVEINAYNANANLFAVITLLVEFVAGRGAKTSQRIHMFKLYSYVGTSGQLNIAFQIIFVILFVLSLFREGKKMVHQKRGYFCRPWNWLEFLRLLLCIAVMALFAAKEIMRVSYVDQLKDVNGQFVSFRSIAVISDVFTSLMALLVFVMTLQFMSLLSFNRLIGVFFHTLQNAAHKIATFSIMFLLILAGGCLLTTYCKRNTREAVYIKEL
ncbi:polycystin-1-like protein 2 [Branchiostoma floridae x Branchiostoma japonicum]